MALGHLFALVAVCLIYLMTILWPSCSPARFPSEALEHAQTRASVLECSAHRTIKINSAKTLYYLGLG